VTVIAALLGAGLAPASALTTSAARPVATIDGNIVTLANGSVTRIWRLSRTGVVTTSLDDPSTGAQWAATSSADFSIELGPLTVTSASGWSGVRASVSTGGRGAGRWARATFTFVPLGSLFELTNVVTLYSGTPTMQSTLSFVNRLPVGVPIVAVHVAQLSTPEGGAATVDAFKGGSDDESTVRTVTVEPAAFDDEGEVATVDVGGGAGWFVATEERGGLMSRVGRTSSGGGWQTWGGDEYGRDLLDTGPIEVPGTTDNRVGNPVPVVPVRTRTVPAGSTVALGTAWLGVYHGGLPAAAAAFASDFDAHDLADFSRTIDQNTFHPFGHSMTAATLPADAAAAAALGVQTFMLDDQWQGKHAGDWVWNSATFPGGTAANHDTPDFVRYLRHLGLKLGLWMSPEAFNPASATYHEHPTWACVPTGNVSAFYPDDSGFGFWDITNPALQAYLTATVNRMIADWHVVEFKFDYLTWLDCPPHSYLDAETAFLSWIRNLERLHPDVNFEIDETIDQRLWALESLTVGPSWFDNDHSNGANIVANIVAKHLSELWSAAPWVPPSSLGISVYDGTLTPPYSVDYLMPMALLGHVTFWDDLTRLTPAQRAETSWWLRWYKQHRSELSGLDYEDSTTDPIDGQAWVALQPWSPPGHGMLVVFRQSSMQSTDHIMLSGIDPARRYKVTDVRTGAVVTTGRLGGGLTVSLPQPYSAAVLSITPAGP